MFVSEPRGGSTVALRFTRFATLCGALAIVCLLTAASAQAAHPRPKSAPVMRLSLVPSYAPCAVPNQLHGPPLDFGSCNPPVQASAQATVGTPDAFGGAANATGNLRLKEIPSIPPAPDTSDLQIDILLMDVRCVPTGARCGTANDSGPADYSGEMQFSFTFRLTDHWNAGDPEDRTPATVQDFAIESSWACLENESTSIGSTCELLTSMNVLIPESVTESRRRSWELDAVQIYDGGPDGEGETTADNTLFARPGIFVP
jgi:hypothetical protein